MGGYSIEMKGLAELEAKLESMAQADAQKIVNRGLKAGGRVFQEAVAEAAPIRPELPSGTALPIGALKSDIIAHKATIEGLPSEVIGPGKYTRHVAIWVEYGHRLVRGGYSRKDKRGTGFRGPGREVGSVPAHPFIRPAFEASVNAAVEATVVTIGKAVEESAKQ